METSKKLSSLREGESCFITGISAPGPLRERLMELGFIKGAGVKCLHRNSGMSAFLISGTVIALRHCDSAGISAENSVS